MNGILCVYKEAGYTSHDVINCLRRISHQKKIGHTGTLDPNAEGVLPVCFGNATKVCGLITDTDKIYRAELILGKVTDTYDITGTEIVLPNKRKREVHVTKEQLGHAIQSMIGVQLQLPPMYSARKINGQKLYDLARQGIEVERTPKEITVYDISLEKICINEASKGQDIEEIESAIITVHCSKGTYIRSICHDIGQKLGCGACMGSLVRTRVGRFDLADCKRIKELQELDEKLGLDKLLIPADAMFPDDPKLLNFDKEAEGLLQNGNHIPLSLLSKTKLCELRETKQSSVRLRMYNKDGRFCALYEYRPDKDYLQPVTMFPEYLAGEK